jgi:hypothetical protein
VAARVSLRSSSIFGNAGTPSQAITRIIVPRDTAINARSTYSNSPDAVFIRKAHDQLTAVRDAEAMQKLADGHTEAFNLYADQRVGSATTPAEKAYWQNLRDRSSQKLEDDALAAGVKDGSKSLEDVQAHLQARAEQVGPRNGDYAGYVAEIGKVKDAIKARDFNGDVTKAQQAYFTSGDKKAYKDALVGFLNRATDSTARSQLLTQVTNLQASIDKDEVTKRVGEATQWLTDAYQGEKTPREVIAFLDKQAAGAKTEQEAQWYANEATKLAAYDRQQQKDAVARAGASGSTAALKSTLLDANDALREAATAVHSEISRQGTPDDPTWKAFTSAHQDYADALAAALPGSSAKNKDAIIKEQARIQSQYDTQFKEVGAAVVKTAEDTATQLATTAKSFSSQAEKGDYTAVSGARYEWAKAYSDAMNSPFVNDAQKRALQDKIQTGPLAAQAADIQTNLSKLRPGGSTKATTTQMDTQYDAYLGEYANATDASRAYDPNAVSPPPKSKADFLAALIGTGGPAGNGKDSQGNPLPDPTNHGQVKNYLFGTAADNATTFKPSNVLKFQDAYNDFTTTAQQERDQAIASIVQLTKSHQPGLVDDRNIAASQNVFKPEDYGPIVPPDPNTLVTAPGGFGVAGSDKAMGGYNSGAQTAESDGQTTDFASGYEPTFGDTASLGSADLTAFNNDASSLARLYAHARGHDFLDQSTPLDLPNYSLPDLPAESPFIGGYAPTFGDQASAMPSAPDAAMPLPPSEAIAFPDAPFVS